ncbi:MAG: peptidase M15 [Bacteroidaceae bacterium]|nr:peptidase M15 [Bacteroidaceae bacterium]
MGTISKNFSYHEFEQSEAARQYRIMNIIGTPEIRDAVKGLVINLLQPLRDKVGRPLNISSGYRCAELNRKVGGVPTSQHCKGEAADVWCATLTPYQLARVVLENGIPYDQMILYPSFVHLSYRKDGEQRKQLLYNASYKGKRFAEV